MKTTHSTSLTTMVALTLIVLFMPASTYAQEKSGTGTAKPADQPAQTNRFAPQAETRSKRLRENAEATAKQLRTGQGPIHIYQLVEEIIDDVVEDINALNMEAVSPAAIKTIDLSRNLSATFGRTLESSLISSIAGSTELQVKRCVACRSLRSRVDNDEWVITLGFTRQESFVREAKKLGVKTFLGVRFDYFPKAETVVLQAELVRANDAAVLWAKTYRSDSTTAAILRSGERTLTRAERLAELERKLEQRPYYGYKTYGGYTFIPYDSPAGNISGPSIGFRIFERFGQSRRLLFGIGGDALIKLSKENPYYGGLIGVIALYEVTEPNLNSLVFRTGPGLSGLLSGNEGNSFAIEWAAEAVFQFRLGLGVSALYVMPVKFAGAELGGFGFKARASFNW